MFLMIEKLSFCLNIYSKMCMMAYNVLGRHFIE